MKSNTHLGEVIFIDSDAEQLASVIEVPEAVQQWWMIVASAIDQIDFTLSGSRQWSFKIENQPLVNWLFERFEANLNGFKIWLMDRLTEKLLAKLSDMDLSINFQSSFTIETTGKTQGLVIHYERFSISGGNQFDLRFMNLEGDFEIGSPTRWTVSDPNTKES